MISPRHTRIAAAATAAGVWTTLSFGTLVEPAYAQPGAAAPFAATLAEPAKDTRLVAGSTLWSCQGTDCVARQSESRPTRICRDLKRKAGTITAFAIAGEPLDAEALARCNS